MKALKFSLYIVPTIIITLTGYYFLINKFEYFLHMLSFLLIILSILFVINAILKRKDIH